MTKETDNISGEHEYLRELWEAGALSIQRGEGAIEPFETPKELRAMRLQLYQYRRVTEKELGHPWHRDVMLRTISPCELQFARVVDPGGILMRDPTTGEDVPLRDAVEYFLSD